MAEARGDKMCQEAMVKVKTAVKSSGEHKQKMVINVSLEGLKLLDEKTGVRVLKMEERWRKSKLTRKSGNKRKRLKKKKLIR